jgi:hypothetical protein
MLVGNGRKNGPSERHTKVEQEVITIFSKGLEGLASFINHFSCWIHAKGPKDSYHIVKVGSETLGNSAGNDDRE